jgi:hypothetical protein
LDVVFVVVFVVVDFSVVVVTCYAMQLAISNDAPMALPMCTVADVHIGGM